MNKIFKINIEQILIPEIKKKFEVNESKIGYNLLELNILLKTNYKLSNMYIRLKDILKDSNIGVSKRNDVIIFTNKERGINKESEIFNVNLENLIPKISNVLDKKKSTFISETDLKKILGVDYKSRNIYQRAKQILLEYNIGIKFKTGKKIDDSFVFYNIKDYSFLENKSVKFTNKLEENISDEVIENDKLKNKIDLDKEYENRMKEIEKIREEEFEEMLPTSESFNCPKCNTLNILVYPEILCKKCNTQLVHWES